MTANPTIHIHLRDHAAPSRGIVETAEAVGKLAAAAIAEGKRVVLVTDGVPGVPSSFFNVVLLLLTPHLRGRALDGCFELQTGSGVVREIYGRSRDAVLRQAGAA